MNGVASGLLRKAGWLLTPFVAGAAAFLGAWLGAVARGRWTPDSSSLWLLVAGGAVAAVATTVVWVVILRAPGRTRSRPSTESEDPHPEPDKS